MIDRASVAEGARLAADATPGPWTPSEKAWLTHLGQRIRDLEAGEDRLAAWLDEEDAAFIAHWNPEFAVELARELRRLWRVEDAARAFLTEDEAEAELIAALTDPAAEEGEQ